MRYSRKLCENASSARHAILGAELIANGDDSLRRLSAIVSLLALRGPAHVPWLIVSEGVYPVHGMQWRRRLADMLGERFETAHPFIANPHSCAAMVFPAFRLLVGASSLHGGPCSVHLALAPVVLFMHSIGDNLCRALSARPGAPRGQIIAVHNFFQAAPRANAFPYASIAAIFASKFKHLPTPERSAGQVDVISISVHEFIMRAILP